MNDQKPTADEPFRESLLDVITICRKLEPYCSDVEMLIGMLQLATENLGQLRLLMAVVIKK